MGKNKRKHPDIEEILARPWCYYCERDFDDLKILINHQKAKHFKCERCGRRLNTAGGLSVHMTQVHKETLTVIENALPNRSGLDVEIFGMEGIPEDIVQTHNQRVVQSFAQAEAERRAATGNTGQDGNAAGAVKKPKFEPPSELKKRLAEHKAKKAAEEAAGISSGNNTPGGFGPPGESVQSPGAFAGAGSPNYSQPPTPFSRPPSSSTYASHPQPHGQHPGPQPSPFLPPQHQSQIQAPPQQPPFQTLQQPGFGPQGMPQYPNTQPLAPPPQFQSPGGPQPFQPHFSNGLPPPSQFQSPPPPHFQNGPPHPFHNGPPQGPPQFHTGPPQPYGAGSPVPFQPAPFQPPPRHVSPPQHLNQFQPPRHSTPPQHGGMPQRPGSLPPAPGLPQRPAFGAPAVNAAEMQQMHQGQLKAPTNHTEHMNSVHQNGYPKAGGPGPQNPQVSQSHPPDGSASMPVASASTLDDLVSGAAREADKAAGAGDSQATAIKAGTGVEEKKGKKDKEKGKLVYSDNDVSPEEKMAQLPRYAFVPAG